MTVQAYPLQWPRGRERTPLSQRATARFGTGKREYFSSGSSYLRRQPVTIGDAKERIYRELERFGAQRCVISSNLMLNLDGTPRASQRAPADPGVAVYFELDGREHVMACDRWDRAADNMAAVAAHIESLRGQLRWGVVDARQAFAGFAALPPPDAPHDWRETFGWRPGYTPTIEQLEEAWRRLRSILHPDKGGDADAFARAKGAYEQACEEIA